MKRSHFALTATVIFAFAGCGATPTTGTMPQTATRSAQTGAYPGARSGGDLLYVDDSGTDYSAPTRSLTTIRRASMLQP